MTESMVDTVARALQPGSLRIEVAADKTVIGADFIFSGNLALFRGHFPGRPIVPGVVLIQAVAWMAHRGARQLTAISRAKFVRPVRPNELVHVTCRCRVHAQEVTVEATVEACGAAAADLMLTLARACDNAGTTHAAHAVLE